MILMMAAEQVMTADTAISGSDHAGPGVLCLDAEPGASVDAILYGFDRCSLAATKEIDPRYETLWHELPITALLVLAALYELETDYSCRWAFVPPTLHWTRGVIASVTDIQAPKVLDENLLQLQAAVLISISTSVVGEDMQKLCKLSADGLEMAVNYGEELGRLLQEVRTS